MMRAQFTDSVALITSKNAEKRDFGTGFIIHQHGQATYLLTCAHVISNVGGEEHIIVRGSPATVVASGGEHGVVLAVLRVDKPLRITVAP